MKLWCLSCLSLFLISTDCESLTQVDAEDKDFPDEKIRSSIKHEFETGKHKQENL